MSGAQRQEVWRVGRAAVLPMRHMVHVQPAGALTARDPATAIPLFDDDPCALRDRPEGTTDAHGVPTVLPDRPDTGVAAQEPADPIRDGRPEVHVTSGVGVRVDVQEGQVPIAVRAAVSTLGQRRSATATNASAQLTDAGGTACGAPGS